MSDEKRDRPPPRLFATAAKGTEGALRDELREHRFKGVRADRGGVHFAGDLVEGYRACLELRIAARVLYQLDAFDAPSGDALYQGVRNIPWEDWMSPRQTLAVRATCRSSALTHTQFIAQRTKDAIVDPFRERTGARPSVDLHDPDVSIFVHLVKDRATVYLDLAGEALHRRGYRIQGAAAPLKETLASAILRLGGWDRERPLIDPMCGSGTIAIEGALWARDIAPGLARARFGFERWTSFDGSAKAKMLELRQAARARVKREGPEIIASDIDDEALDAAAANARRSGLSLAFRRADVRDLAPGARPGHVVTNPPYGERLDADRDLYAAMARSFSRLAGHRISILANGPEVVRPIRVRPASSFEVYNGDIPCRLISFDVP